VPITSRKAALGSSCRGAGGRVQSSHRHPCKRDRSLKSPTPTLHFHRQLPAPLQRLRSHTSLLSCYINLVLKPRCFSKHLSHLSALSHLASKRPPAALRQHSPCFQSAATPFLAVAQPSSAPAALPAIENHHGQLLPKQTEGAGRVQAVRIIPIRLLDWDMRLSQWVWGCGVANLSC